MPIIRDFIHNMTKPKNSANFVGRESFRTSNPYILSCYDEDKYSSIYPSVKAISNEFMKIRPKATGANGEPRDKVPALNALYHPNQLDSSVAFREKLAVMNLTHRNTYLLVWRRQGNEAVPGGEITDRNIAGYTFLENPGIERRDGRTYYKMGAQEFSDKEVITIPGGVDPSGLYNGYAPGIASASWATLDQYIADFQKGFFENGAVPAGQFVITAATVQDYNDTVDKLQEAHRGAGKNNNVTYTPRPVDPNTGKPGESKIEWIPFQTSNKDIDFKTLFEQANNRIDSTFGVPASIRGVGESNNYATARIDQQNFIRFTIEPLALRIYTQITHELNRISGGLGVAITFDLKYPAIADEEKVQAETKQVEVNTLLSLITAGYSLDTAVDALEISVGYKNLSLIQAPAVIDNDKPEVDEGGEVEDSPNPSKIDGVTPLNEAAKSKNPKAEVTNEERIAAVTRQFMQEQVDRAIQEFKDTPSNLEEPTEDELARFVATLLPIITGILIANGEEGYAAAVGLASLNIDDLQGFALTETVQDAYEAYLERIGTTYGNDTAESIRKVLLESRNNELTRRQTEELLHGIMDTDEYRVLRLARTELNHSQNLGNLEGFKSLAAETDTQWEKTIDHSNTTPCPLCASQEGIWTALDQPLWDFGAPIEVTEDDGKVVTYVNNWQTNEAQDFHPNGTGTLVFRRVSQ